MEDRQIKEVAARFCEGKGFTLLQKEKIEQGFRDGLSEETVGLYAKAEFNDMQTFMVYWGLTSGLTVEQVKVYADSRLDAAVMDQARSGFLSGLSLEQVEFLLGFDAEQAREIRFGFEGGLSMEQVCSFAKKEFCGEHMGVLRKAILKGYSSERFGVLSNPEFDGKQAKMIFFGYEAGLHDKQVAVFADSRFTWEQMDMLSSFFVRRIPVAKMLPFARPEFSVEQLEIIREGLRRRLSLEEMERIAKPELEPREMFFLLKAVLRAEKGVEAPVQENDEEMGHISEVADSCGIVDERNQEDNPIKEHKEIARELHVNEGSIEDLEEFEFSFDGDSHSEFEEDFLKLMEAYDRPDVEERKVSLDEKMRDAEKRAGQTVENRKDFERSL